MATANFIYERKQDATVYMIGEEGLHDALVEKGFELVDENPDFVVVGLDRDITYEKLAKRVLLCVMAQRLFLQMGILPSQLSEDYYQVMVH